MYLNIVLFFLAELLTRISYLRVLLAVAKFQYHNEITSSDYSEVPAVKVLRRRMSLVNNELNNHVPVADIAKKWLDLPEVLKQIVERLRLECQPRKTSDSVKNRNATAIASSFQQYILWGLLTYSPPRRQQELRGLKIVVKCPIKRPVDVPADGFYQPLPTGNDRDRKYGYLYRKPDGRWFKNLTPECYKTGKTYGKQDLEISNEKFADGSCFYDYLEAWLYGYPKKGKNSAGSKKRSTSNGPTKRSNGPWYSCGRLDFVADHDFVFVQQNGKPFSGSQLGQYLSTGAHALTGQRLTPHLLRDIFATYFLNEGAPDSDVASLAYAMGHSQEMLKATYDRRTPNQKHKAIQLALSKVVQESL